MHEFCAHDRTGLFIRPLTQVSPEVVFFFFNPSFINQVTKLMGNRHKCCTCLLFQLSCFKLVLWINYDIVIRTLLELVLSNKLQIYPILLNTK